MTGDLYRTAHFQERQEERQVPQRLIEDIKYSLLKTRRKTTVIISRKLLRKYGVKKQMDLFLIIDTSTLITCYYRDFQEFISTSFKQDKYLIINEINSNQ